MFIKMCVFENETQDVLKPTPHISTNGNEKWKDTLKYLYQIHISYLIGAHSCCD